MIKINKNQIDEIAGRCENSDEFTLEMYKLAFPNWELISQIKGFPKVGNDTADYLMGKALETDKQQAGATLLGSWFNKGFSIDNDTEEWCIDTSECEVDI